MAVPSERSTGEKTGNKKKYTQRRTRWRLKECKHPFPHTSQIAKSSHPLHMPPQIRLFGLSLPSLDRERHLGAKLVRRDSVGFNREGVVYRA